MTAAEVRYEVGDGVATLTLNRPEKLNAVTSQTIRELVEAFDRADADDTVRAVIVPGLAAPSARGRPELGARTFDSAARGRAETAEEHRDDGGLVTLRLYDITKPVIAAINGPAVGFGITLTLPMDVRIAAREARLGFVFARRGVVPEACSTWFLPRLVGISQAQEWVLTGRLFSAEEARAGGLVSRVVAPEALLPTARELAREIAAKPSAISAALARQMMWKLLGADHPRAAHTPRLPRDLLDGTLRRRPRGRHGVRREAAGPLHARAEQGHAALLSLVGIASRLTCTLVALHLAPSCLSG